MTKDKQPPGLLITWGLWGIPSSIALTTSTALSETYLETGLGPFRLGGFDSWRLSNVPVHYAQLSPFLILQVPNLTN